MPLSLIALINNKPQLMCDIAMVLKVFEQNYKAQAQAAGVRESSICLDSMKRLKRVVSVFGKFSLPT